MSRQNPIYVSRLCVRLTTSGMVLLGEILHQMVKAIALIGIALDLFVFYSKWEGESASGRKMGKAMRQRSPEAP